MNLPPFQGWKLHCLLNRVGGNEASIQEGRKKMLNHKKLKCYELALDVARSVPSTTKSWPRGTSYLIDQLRRAASSIVLNIAEGNGRRLLGERKRFFSIARASATETSAIMDIAEALAYIDYSTYESVQDKLLQIVKILYKLR